MSPSQLFHIPTALKRSHSKAVPPQQRQSNRHETKAENILGVTEADIKPARNKSISSVATNRLQGNLSDATTEFGTSLPRDGKITQVPELRLKASSVLLHDDFSRHPESASSMRSSRLKAYDSNSTLHSHYDSQRAPLAISQQTSDSSRRDFALRKGKPPVVNAPSKPRGPLRQTNLFTPSMPRSNGESKKLSKERPQTGSTMSHVSLSSSRPPTSKTKPPSSPTSAYPPRSHQRVQFAQASTSAPRTKNTLLEPLDPACVKVNVRRPRVGAKHWFDGHEGDSSDEGSINEPAFEDTFVVGVESAFQNGRIKPPSDASTITTTAISSSLSEASTPKSSAFRFPKAEPQPIVPRIAVLTAKASNATLRSAPSQRPSTKRRPDPMARRDLNNTSMLNLSSSDDEDEPITPQRVEALPSEPQLRDSVAIAFNKAPHVELGLAEAISAIPSGPEQSQVRTLKVVSQHHKRGQLYMPIPKRTSSRMLTQMSNQTEVNDLLASFPPTPLESVYSHRTSIRSSLAPSEVDTLESRRLMSVTKQEESLLAAIRLKKAAMKYKSTHDNRLATLRNLERAQSRSQSTLSSNKAFYSATQLVVDTRSSSEQPSSHYHHRRSFSNEEGTQHRASGTTFQTTTSRNPSRVSRLTSYTDQSADNLTRLSLSSEASPDVSRSPSLLSLTTADRRRSRDTFLSSHSPVHTGHVRRGTANSHIVALDELDKVPQRDDIPSQEFIDWPYKGWEDRAKVGVAH